MIESIITHVRKNEKGVITHVKANGTELQKFIVVQNILHLHMVYKVPSGAKIHVVDEEYIRSDPNPIMEDNLGELPTF